MAGFISNSVLDKIVVHVNVTSISSAGGIAANVIDSKILSSQTTCNVEGYYNVGGFIGYSTGGIYTDCISNSNVVVLGDVTQTSFEGLSEINNESCKFAGSFIGKLDVSGGYDLTADVRNQIKIINSNSSGSVTYMNGLVVENKLSNYEFANCFIGRIIISDNQLTEVIISGCKCVNVAYAQTTLVTLTKQSITDFQINSNVVINYSSTPIFDLEISSN